ncbi:hypothetical protein [Prescottella agglutinans]|uniref:hypothetical protein n=1 Tax=Prescottella agglutinans TaxID=1644129 RepID=UPI003D96E4F4
MPSSPSPYRFAAVSHIARVTPDMQRITLSGGDLTGFVSSATPTSAYSWCPGRRDRVRFWASRPRRVRHELGLPTERYDVIGYWHAYKEAWTARHEQVRDRIEAARTAALEAGGDFHAVRDAVDAAMDHAGV